jgi:hypothetical protein
MMRNSSQSSQILKPDFVFSQHSLQDLVDCKRRFYLRHIRRLAWPAAIAEPFLEYENQILLGEAFHNLIHQFYSSISIEVLSSFAQNIHLSEWWGNFLDAVQQMAIPKPSIHSCFSEMSLIVPFHNYRLIAKYDLLALGENDIEPIVIWDWKTSQNKPKRQVLERRLQSVVYPFILYHSNFRGAIKSHLKMIYWYANYPDKPEVLWYSLDEYRANEQQLITLLDSVTHASKSDLSPENQYPMTDDLHRCTYCNYRSFCNRGISAGHLIMEELEIEDDESMHSASIEFSTDEIPEIEY